MITRNPGGAFTQNITLTLALSHRGGVVLKVLFYVTLSAAKGLGVVGFIRITNIPTQRFFVTSLLRMTFDTKPIEGEDLSFTD